VSSLSTRYAPIHPTSLILTLLQFDQINYDVTPYLALSPTTFRSRVDTLSDPQKSWHFEVKNATFNFHGPYWWNGDERQLASMMAGFSRALPDLEVHGDLNGDGLRGDNWIGEDYRIAAKEKLRNGTCEYTVVS